MSETIANIASMIVLFALGAAIYYLSRDRKKAKVSGWIALGAFIVVGIFAPDPAAEQLIAQTATEQPDMPAKPAKPSAIDVTATALFADYEANEVAADNRYKGKTLLVAGYVQQIGKDFTGDVYVDMATGNEFMPARAHLEDGEAGKAAGLGRGDIVVVLCTGDGITIGAPMLVDCVIQ